jgi:hypothetical protein
LKVLLFKINNDKFTIIYEPIDKDGYPIKFDISGPSCQRTLYVTWSITSDFNKVSVCHVTTNGIEFIKIFCCPQDLPHGVLISINGIKHEVIDIKTKYENSTYYKNYMWQTIKSELACTTDVETASKILEHATRRDFRKQRHYYISTDYRHAKRYGQKTNRGFKKY